MDTECTVEHYYDAINKQVASLTVEVNTIRGEQDKKLNMFRNDLASRFVTKSTFYWFLGLIVTISIGLGTIGSRFVLRAEQRIVEANHTVNEKIDRLDERIDKLILEVKRNGENNNEN